jgi:molecular chaperone DnaK
VFTTVRDNQTSVRIMVFQGESERAEENELLGEFILSDLRRAPRGEVEVEVTFEISADGIVSVLAKDLETGQQQSITVTATSGLTEEEIRQMAEDAREHAVQTKSSDAFEQDKAKAQTLMRDIRTLLDRVQEFMSGSDFGREALEKAEKILEDTQGAIDRRNHEELKRLIGSLERTLKMLRGVDDRM